MPSRLATPCPPVLQHRPHLRGAMVGFGRETKDRARSQKVVINLGIPSLLRR